MIIIHATLVFASEADIETFCTSRQRQVEETRAEEGCLLYTFARDIVDPRVLQVAETWQDERTLEAHRKVLHARPVSPNLPKPASVTVKQYDGAKEVPFAAR